MFRVMIVDDECSIRNGLKNFINWYDIDCEIVYSAEDGIDAKENLTLINPHIIITDIKMPGMNGIELSKYVYENYPDIKVIVLTGYSDFSYAQAAIKYNVVDFVLKPTSTDKILEAISKAKKLIMESREKDSKLQDLVEKVSSNTCEIREKLFIDLIFRMTLDEKLINRKIKDLNLNIEKYLLIVYEIDYRSNEPRNYSASPVFRFLDLAFKDIEHYTFGVGSSHLCTIAAFPSNYERSECLYKTVSVCEEVIKMVDNFMEFTLSIGISNIHFSIAEIPSAYEEAETALANRFFNENNMFIYNPEIHSQSSYEKSILNRDIDQIMAYIHSGDASKAIDAVNGLFEKLKESKQSVEYIKNISIVICSLCSKTLSNYNLDMISIFKSSENLYKKILQTKTISSLFAILSEVIGAFTSKLNFLPVNSNNTVEKVMTYIRKNYNQVFSLQAIADYVHMNGSYLSRLFRKETGETLTDALARYRVEKAKELLCNPDIKTYTVASMVGISDAAYFSYIFKKYTGLSPKEYKSSISITGQYDIF